MKTVEQISNEYKELSKALYVALSTFERKDVIRDIREKIISNQRQCTHYSKVLNFSVTNGCCPYCGKQLIDK